MSFAELASANVVGYVQKEQNSGAYSKVACFDGVASEPMDIQNIIPAFPEGEEYYSGGIQIMTLTDATATDRTYLYVTAADAEGIDGKAIAGWFDDGMTTRMSGENAVTFQPGEGFLVLSDLDGASVTFSGSVAQGDTIVELGAGANFCGNNALNALDIQSITVGTQCSDAGILSTPEEDLYSGAFQIMTLTDATATDRTYLYVTAADAEGIDGKAVAGWFDDGMTARMSGEDAVQFEAGEGFLVLTDYEAAFVKIPGNPALN